MDNANRGITDMHFLNHKVGFACGYGGTQFFSGNFYKTTDGGHNWVVQIDPLDSLPVDGMQMVNEQYGYGWGNVFGFKTLLRTTDSGNIWQKYYSHPSIPVGMFWWDVNEGILIDGNGGIYKTYNAGQNWKKITSPVSSALLNSVSFIGKKTGYIVGNGLIWKSVNKGETWTKEISPTTKFLTKVEFHDNYPYATGFNGVILWSQYITTVDRVMADEAFKIFPNPANDKLYFSSGSINPEISIFDVSGKRVLHKYMQGKSGVIDISMWQKGLYWVRIEGMEPVKISIQ